MQGSLFVRLNKFQRYFFNELRHARPKIREVEIVSTAGRVNRVMYLQFIKNMLQI